MIDRWAACSLLVLASVACSSRLPSRPDLYTQSRDQVGSEGRTLHLDLVTPVRATHPGVMIVYATGDAGYYGVSKQIFGHMAERGYTMAAIDSSESVKNIKHTGGKLTFAQGAARIDAALKEAKKKLGLPENERVILVGYSRGAGVAAFAAGEATLQRDIVGSVAIALTREGDYLKAPDPPNRPSSIQVDDKGRVQTYPALARLGDIKVAVIQSTGDPYVGADEARTLFGPDTATRRFYRVEARNHGFSGGHERLMSDLDDALSWIEADKAP